ncbi:MAG: hypothetical protein WA160_02245 [Pseudobdellovibrio sp.]
MNKAFYAIADMIKENRLKANLTQLEISSKIGQTSYQFFSLIERHHSRVPLLMLGQLIVILNLPEEKIKNLLIEDYTEYITAEFEAGKAEELSLKTLNKQLLRDQENLAKKIFKLNQKKANFLEKQIKLAELVKTPIKCEKKNLKKLEKQSDHKV